MKNLKKLIPMIVLVAVVLTLWGGTFFTIVMYLGGFAKADGNFRYIVKDGEALIVEYKDLQGIEIVTIPETMGGYPVTTVNKFGLVNTIGVKEIIIGKNLVNIFSWSFVNNGALERFIVDDENPALKAVDGVLFTKDMETLITYPGSRFINEIKPNEEIAEKDKIFEYTVPDTVKNIGPQAFYKCGKLTKITFNEGLETIGEDAFTLAVNMENVIFPEGLKSIGVHAFNGCANGDRKVFNQIEIPSSVDYIGDWAFYNCSYVVSVVVYKAEADTQGWGFKWFPTSGGDNLSVDGVTLKIEYRG